MLKVKSLPKERWTLIKTPIQNKNFNYFISDHGRVKSVNRFNDLEKLLNNIVFKTIHRYNLVLKRKQCFNFAIHKLVAEYYLPPKKKEHVYVIHIDHDKSNNHYKNLKWVNREEMNEVAKERGYNDPRKRLHGKGYKMTEAKVRKLKKQLAEGVDDKVALAKKYNISYMQLNRIERGENWGYVKI